MPLRTVHLTSAAPPHVQPHLLTLNRRAATRYGRAAQSLASLARDHLGTLGWSVASPVQAHRLLSAAVADEGVSARAYGAVVREFLRVEADLDALERDDVPRVRQVARLAARYRALLRAGKLVDGAELLTVAANSIPRLGALTLLGYVRLTRDELRLLDTLAGEGSEVWLPWAEDALFDENDRAAVWLETRGWTVVRDEREPGGAAGAFLGLGERAAPARSCASPEDEVRAALADIRGLLTRGVPSEDIALVTVDDAAWAPLVEAVAWEYAVPVSVTASVPLADTSVGSWLARALDVVEGRVDFETVARLLGHPLDQGLDPTSWRALRRERPGTFDAWTEAGVTLDGFVWPEQDTRAGGRARLLELLRARGIRARASERRPLDQVALDTLEKELIVLAEPAGETLSRGALIEELRALLALLAVAPEPRADAVELVTPYALIGARVPHVFALGLAEGAWPAPLHDDPVLDFVERARLRRAGVPLEVPGSLARRDLLSFWSLLRAAPEALTLSFAARDALGKETLPSAYLTRLGVRIEPYEESAVCSVEEARRSDLGSDESAPDEVLDFARAAFEVERRREAHLTFDEYDGLTGLPVDVDARVFSANQLRTLGTCTFRWWLAYILRIEAQGEDEDDTLGLGQLQHAVLRRLAREAIARRDEDAREVMLGALDHALSEAETELGWPRTRTWALQRPEVRARLDRLLRAPAFLVPGARIEAAEVEFEGVWQGFRVRGQVDRIDRLGGKLTVLDYKSGRSRPWGAQDTDRKLNLDLQLPIYLQAALPALYPQEPTGGAAYLSLKTAEVIGRVTLSEAAFEAFAARTRRALETGAFVPSPDAARRACTRCPFPPVCRAGPRLERKNAVGT
ncbi:PD-(D/E)XK nuclease family protein [Deinococcus pimensis]|uniref:PD-(D/E)XK nuclease family protein n=1 Tax=Deinococcus pimensis TaxID=309888 RepID=UPI0004816F09|nr:PD-(D/E)XK nuclease family protein [Deinococcus pimensis]